MQQQINQQKDLLAKVSALPKTAKDERAVLMGQLKTLNAAIEVSMKEAKAAAGGGGAGSAAATVASAGAAAQ